MGPSLLADQERRSSDSKEVTEIIRNPRRERLASIDSFRREALCQEPSQTQEKNGLSRRGGKSQQKWFQRPRTSLFRSYQQRRGENWQKVGGKETPAHFLQRPQMVNSKAGVLACNRRTIQSLFQGLEYGHKRKSTRADPGAF